MIRRDLAITTTVAAAIPLAAAIFLYTQFVPPLQPVIVTPFAPEGTSCESWIRIWAPASPRHPLAIVVRPCLSGEPGELPPGSVAAILDPAYPEPGGSGPAANRRDLFQIRINPKTANSWTWRHEVRHILSGHAAVADSVPLGFKGAVNALLDLAFIDPYLVFGSAWRDGWSVCIAAILLAALIAAWLWPWGEVTRKSQPKSMSRPPVSHARARK